MKPAALLLTLSVLAAFAAGCAVRVKSYEPMVNLAEARDAAGLIATGQVTKVDTLQHNMGNEVIASGFNTLGRECVAKEQVTFIPTSVGKGAATAGQPLTFFFYDACFHPAKGLKLIRNQPAIVPNDKLTAYLQHRADGWWLIAHKLESPTPPSDDTDRIKIYTGTY